MGDPVSKIKTKEKNPRRMATSEVDLWFLEECAPAFMCTFMDRERGGREEGGREERRETGTQRSDR